MKRKISLEGIKYFDENGVAHISKEISDVSDLIDLANTYNRNLRYNINLRKLVEIKSEMMLLNNLIGLNNIKRDIVTQILYFVQNFHDQNMLHVVIQGSPGVGKTKLANIIGKIYFKLNVLNSDGSNHPKIVVAKRSDLIGEYLGTTAKKTQEVINASKGGILLIDEAYALGNKEGRDSYSKECIDTLNQNLSEGKADFLCIVAGYKDSLEQCLFKHNAGLKRRFPFVYTINNYTAVELSLIYTQMINKEAWSFHEEHRSDMKALFKSEYDLFGNMGGDVETLWFFTKLEHSKRVFCLSEKMKKIVTLTDTKNGMNKLKEMKGPTDKDHTPTSIISHMYM